MKGFKMKSLKKKKRSTVEKRTSDSQRAPSLLLVGLLFVVIFSATLLLYNIDLKPFAKTNSYSFTSLLVNIESIASKEDIKNHSAPHLPETKSENTQVTFTHVFSSYVTQDEVSKIEFDAVFTSWQEAAEASRRYGINVEYIDAVLPQDIASVPDFVSKSVVLKRYTKNTNGISVPTVGDIFKAGYEAGSGRWLIFTNADIAVVPEFYKKVYKFLTTDYLDPEQQSFLRTEMYKAKLRCLTLQKFINAELCEADTREVYENLGGIPRIYDEFALDVSTMLMRAILHESKGKWLCTVRSFWSPFCFRQQKSIGLDVTKVNLQIKRKNFIFQLFNAIHGRSLSPKQAWTQIEHLIESWSSNALPVLSTTLFTPKLHSLAEGDTVPETAATITRIDIPFERYTENTVKNSSIPVLENYGVLHPGNDCFVFPRYKTPKMIMDMIHPVGLRPWGMWVPHIFRWDKSMAWRRLTGTPTNPFTYHIGVGLWRHGKGDDKWKERATTERELILFLTAHWYKVTQGKFAHVFDVPSYCNNIKYWRQDIYCEKGQSIYCRGLARFSCSKYQHRNSRDVNVYMQSCNILSKQKTIPLKQPVCDFCNFLIKKFKNGNYAKQFSCLNENMEESRIFFTDN